MLLRLVRRRQRAGDGRAVVGALSQQTPTATQKNVIADSTWGDPNSVIVVGAHLDSHLEGPGINDNGSGTAAILETAIQMAKLGHTYRNRVRLPSGAPRRSGSSARRGQLAQLVASGEIADVGQSQLRHAGLAELRAVRLRR